MGWLLKSHLSKIFLCLIKNSYQDAKECDAKAGFNLPGIGLQPTLVKISLKDIALGLVLIYFVPPKN
jgi:hypothetical protein